MDDSTNPAWRPEWRRKQKRTTRNAPSSVVTDQSKADKLQQKEDELDNAIRAMIPKPATISNAHLSPADFLQLLQALEYYATRNKYAYNVAQFILRYTSMDSSYIKNRMNKYNTSVSVAVDDDDKGDSKGETSQVSNSQQDATKDGKEGKTGENRYFKQEKRLYSRACESFEHNITSNHLFSNPQFAQFYLKNRYGYADKTESTSSGSVNIAIDARSFLQQLGRVDQAGKILPEVDDIPPVVFSPTNNNQLP